MELDKLLEKFTEITEIKAYANAQYNTILDLQNKLQAANGEIEHLKSILDGISPNLSAKELLKGSNQEEVCKRELYKLNERSKISALTLEETKKVEIYTKLLIALNGKDKPRDNIGEDLSDEQLLNVVEMLDGKTGSK